MSEQVVSPFPVRLRAASIVGRWSIIWTHAPDNVATHSFFAIYYAIVIADLLKSKVDRGKLAVITVLHDLDELFTGDIVGVVKRSIVDEVAAAKFVRRKMREVTPGLIVMENEYNDVDKYGVSLDDIATIIKAADRLDALFFALAEVALGNRIIEARLPSLTSRLDEAWRNLPADEQTLHDLWETYISPAIAAHMLPANYDIGG